MKLQGIKMGVLGDSITEGMGVAEYKNLYHQRLKRECGMREVYVDGISGTRIAKQHSSSENPRYDMDFISRVDKIDMDCNLILVFGGTNDFGHGDAPIGNWEDKTADTFWGACHVMCEKLICRFPDSQIVFLTPLHRSDEVNSNGENLSEYIEILQITLKKYSIPYIDMAAISGIAPNVRIQRELYMPDGLHPNDAGHERMTARIKTFLENL